MLRIVKGAAQAASAVEGMAVTPRPDDLLPLVRAVVEGDEAAMATLVMRVGPSMLKAVRSVLGRGHPDVEDVAQDAVIAFLSSLPGFRAGSTVHYYADRVALLTALAARRRARTRSRHFDLTGEPPTHIPDERAVSPLAEVVARRRRETLLQLLDELPTATAEALALHFILGHTVDEIAEAAGAPINTVWSRLRLGKESLRKKLAQDETLTEIVRGST